MSVPSDGRQEDVVPPPVFGNTAGWNDPPANVVNHHTNRLQRMKRPLDPTIVNANTGYAGQYGYGQPSQQGAPYTQGQISYGQTQPVQQPYGPQAHYGQAQQGQAPFGQFQQVQGQSFTGFGGPAEPQQVGFGGVPQGPALGGLACFTPQQPGFAPYNQPQHNPLQPQQSHPGFSVQNAGPSTPSL